ncbi:ANGP1 protein, partial [Polypterus senegalus]
MANLGEGPVLTFPGIEEQILNAVSSCGPRLLFTALDFCSQPPAIFTGLLMNSMAALEFGNGTALRRRAALRGSAHIRSSKRMARISARLPDVSTLRVTRAQQTSPTKTNKRPSFMEQIENYIQENMKNEMVQIQQNAVQNHTATMLEIGTNLLSQTAEQTRKLTNVETQVLNQTTRLEIQLLENSLSTNKLEKQLLVQMNEISKLFEKNRFLENKILEMEDRHRLELETLRAEKVTFQNLVGRQSNIIQELEKQLSKATSNNSILQKQQLDLAEMVHNLINLYAKDGAVPNSTEKEDEEKKFRDCADIYNAGFNKSGVYNININTLSEPKKVYCNMDVAGGGWTVIQHREDGSVDFHRIWKEYKMGFGSLSAEHWLGNEFVFLLTNQREYSLRIELTDWDGNQAFSQYDRFHIGNEKQNYRLFLKSHSGTAGKQSSMVIHGANFSTKDADNDNCICKCALMLTGGQTLERHNTLDKFFRNRQHVLIESRRLDRRETRSAGSELSATKAPTENQSAESGLPGQSQPSGRGNLSRRRHDGVETPK